MCPLYMALGKRGGKGFSQPGESVEATQILAQCSGAFTGHLKSLIA